MIQCEHAFYGHFFYCRYPWSRGPSWLETWKSDFPTMPHMFRKSQCAFQLFACFLADDEILDESILRSTVSTFKMSLWRVSKKKYFLSTIAPVLHSLPFPGVHKCVEHYALFRSEAMQVLSLGVSRTRKNCLVQIPGNTTRTTPTIYNPHGQNKNFKHIWKRVLRWMNVFFREIEKISSGLGLTIDFSKGGSGDGSTGLFSELGLRSNALSIRLWLSIPGLLVSESHF